MEAAKAAGWARLLVPPGNEGQAVPLSTPETVITPEEAIEIIGGGISRKWLLRHTRGLRFRRDLSRKVVRFERAGLMRWMAARRA